MAYDGSGTFNRPVSDYVFDTIISETDMNTEMAGIATGLSTALTKDGQTDPTANLPMNGYRHTGVGAASARTHYGTVAGIQDGDYLEIASVAGTDTITGSVSPAITAYAAGQTFRFVAAGANTGAATLNLNSVGAVAIEKRQAALAAGDIASGDTVEVYYDGSTFQMLSPIRTEPLSGVDGTIITGTAGTADYTAKWNADGDLMDGFEVLDEDNMASDSATKLATQQSIKAYVDSIAPAAASLAKAWASITWSAGTPTLDANYNVSGIVDDGVGVITVTWDTDFANTDYAVIATAESAGQVTTTFIGQSSKAVGSVGVQINRTDTGAAIDPTSLSVVAFGTQ